MNLNESGEKQASLQQALDIRASIPDMENRGASKTEMEDKVTEANRLIEESEKLDAGLKAASLEKARKLKTQVIFIIVSLLVAVIAMQFVK
jgi:hypothetical protein